MIADSSNPTSWVQKTRDVVGGKPCIRNTRISVHGIVEWRKLGLSDDEIMRSIAGLTQDDLHAAWSYYDQHCDEIEGILRMEAQA